ncbi:MAG: 30S ribosomal protein S6 [Bryobacteraceae bacterium]
MRIYEELFIVRPEAPDEEIDPLIEQLKGVITHAGGTVDKVEKWGVRKLAYKIAKNRDGYYILLQFTAQAETVKEIERRLRVADLVVKFLTVRIDEKLKWLEKRRKIREKRAARKPAPAPSPAVTASPAFPGEPAPASPVPGAPAAVHGAPAAAPPAPEERAEETAQ